jgi:N-methylhydantoinase A
LELVTVRGSAWGQAPVLDARAPASGATRASETRRIVLDGQAVDAAILRGELAPGTRLQGPVLCALPEATVLVPPGWAGEVDAHGSALLRRTETGQ